MSSPIEGPYQRDIQLQWVAPDPIIRDPEMQSAIAWAGTLEGGRTYNLTFNRIYPVGGGAPTIPEWSPPGDLPSEPRIMIYGPITGPRVELRAVIPGSTATVYGTVSFESGFHIDAGRWVDVDCRTHTALLDSDPTQPVLNRLVFGDTAWPFVWPDPYHNYMALTGGSTSGISQAQCFWQNGFLE
jgi:hypothetical protein